VTEVSRRAGDIGEILLADGGPLILVDGDAVLKTEIARLARTLGSSRDASPVVIDIGPALPARVAEVPDVVDPGAYALDAWAVGLDAEGVTVGGRTITEDAARALWTRLGAVLGQIDHDVNAASWDALRATLDAEFGAAMPTRARLRRPKTKARPAAERDVKGMLYRCGPRWAMIRVGAFETALLAPYTHKDGSTGWEGGVRRLWPGSLDDPQGRLNGNRVRVTDEAVAAAPMVDELLGRVVRRPREIVRPNAESAQVRRQPGRASAMPP